MRNRRSLRTGEKWAAAGAGSRTVSWRNLAWRRGAVLTRRTQVLVRAADEIFLDEAQLVVDTMLKAAMAQNLRFAAAVVDSGGELICVARSDDATPLDARMCVNKVYTAVKWRQNTEALKERLFDMSLGDDRGDIAWFGDPRFTPVWGGILLKADDGTVLGAFGESGGSPAQDEELGQVGAKAFAAL